MVGGEVRDHTFRKERTGKEHHILHPSESSQVLVPHKGSVTVKKTQQRLGSSDGAGSKDFLFSD
jgi:hypothetical protein